MFCKNSKKLISDVLTPYQLQPLKSKLLKKLNNLYLMQSFKIKAITVKQTIDAYDRLVQKYKCKQLSINSIDWFKNQRRLFLWYLICYVQQRQTSIQNLSNQEWENMSILFWNKNWLFLKFQGLTIFKNIKRHTWVTGDDILLQKYIKKLGINEWNQISKSIFMHEQQGRFISSKQCRQRWFNHLNKQINRGQWTIEEEIRLLYLSISMGKRWSTIARQLKTHRTQHMVKNRYVSLLNRVRKNKKQEQEILVNKAIQIKEQQKKERQKNQQIQEQKMLSQLQQIKQQKIQKEFKILINSKQQNKLQCLSKNNQQQKTQQNQIQKLKQIQIQTQTQTQKYEQKNNKIVQNNQNQHLQLKKQQNTNYTNDLLKYSIFQNYTNNQIGNLFSSQTDKQQQKFNFNSNKSFVLFQQSQNQQNQQQQQDKINQNVSSCNDIHSIKFIQVERGQHKNINTFVSNKLSLSQIIEEVNQPQKNCQAKIFYNKNKRFFQNNKQRRLTLSQLVQSQFIPEGDNFTLAITPATIKSISPGFPANFLGAFGICDSGFEKKKQQSNSNFNPSGVFSHMLLSQSGISSQVKRSFIQPIDPSGVALERQYHEIMNKIQQNKDKQSMI